MSSSIIKTLQVWSYKIYQASWIKDAFVIISLMYDKYVTPVVRFFSPITTVVFGWYAIAFKRMAFVNEELSHLKAATIAVPVLVVSTWFIVTVGIPETYDVIVDGIGVMTEREEHVFLTGAGPVPGDPTEQIFRAKGCQTLPCTEDSATYYHIRPNSVKTMIKLVTQGTIYLPEEVEAAIPDQLSECTIVIQWFRWRTFKMYNTITEVSCMPVAQGK